MKASNYLMEAAHSFRIYLKNHCAVRKPKRGEAPKPEPKPNKAVIWVAKEYPKWQHIILSTLKEFNGVIYIQLCLFFVRFLLKAKKILWLNFNLSYLGNDIIAIQKEWLP